MGHGCRIGGHPRPPRDRPARRPAARGGAGEPILRCPARRTDLEVILAWLDARRRWDLLALKMQVDPAILGRGCVTT
jgi:hypothetical protein